MIGEGSPMEKDLIVLVADKNMQFALDGLLSRYHALQIIPITYDIYVHPLRDPGVYRQSINFLRLFHKQYRYALVFLDREGSGQEQKSANQIEDEIRRNLENNGWPGRAEVIVFDPELEIWAWVNSPHVATSLGWNNFTSLETFVKERDFWTEEVSKPNRPKEAVEAALKEKRIQRSSAIYKKIASDASFRDCREPSFLRFKNVLRNWFAEGEVD